jgi:hypothetical protein
MQTLYQLPLSFEQILILIRQLSPSQKNQILQELEAERRTQKLDTFLQDFQTEELSLEDITAEVEAVRAEKYSQVNA